MQYHKLLALPFLLAQLVNAAASVILRSSDSAAFKRWF